MSGNANLNAETDEMLDKGLMIVKFHTKDETYDEETTTVPGNAAYNVYISF